MDILTALSNESDYSLNQLQAILTGWVLAEPLDRRKKVQSDNGHVEEEDYDKKSIYSLLYAMYRNMGEVRSDTGETYELTFNTWGYAWPEDWGTPPTKPSDPQRFGRNAYTGLLQFDEVKKYVDERDGKVHIVEMGCGTGAGAHHICKNVLPNCTYRAIDMQSAAINTCKRKFVPELPFRLVATHADATQLDLGEEKADFIVVCETHVTEYPGFVSEHDERFFASMYNILKPGGYLVWGNAIPENTWQPCFDHLESIGIEIIENRDVTKYAVQARDEDAGRVEAYVRQTLDKFYGFRIPFVGPKRRAEAEVALKNFYRDPGTNLYNNMTDGTDTYRVILGRKKLD